MFAQDGLGTGQLSLAACHYRYAMGNIHIFASHGVGPYSIDGYTLLEICRPFRERIQGTKRRRHRITIIFNELNNYSYVMGALQASLMLWR